MLDIERDFGKTAMMKQFGIQPKSKSWLERQKNNLKKSEFTKKLTPSIALWKHRPVFTLILLGILLVIFLLELVVNAIHTSISLFSPHVAILMALGGSSPYFVLQEREWYRLISSVFLHANWVHLLMNGLSLWFVGSFVERWVGKSWFFLVFLLSGIAGSALGVLIHAEHTVAVGASGGIMGLIGMMLVLAFRFSLPSERHALQAQCLQMMIPSLIPIFGGFFFGSIDYIGHAGGVLCGMAIGALLLKIWPRNKAWPKGRTLALVCAILLCVAVIVAAAMIVWKYPLYKFLIKLILRHEKEGYLD